MKDTITIGQRKTVARGKTRTYLEAKIGEPHLAQIGGKLGDQLSIAKRGKSLVLTPKK